MSLIERNAAPRLRELLQSFRVVLLGGARQTGKTTLARDLLELPEQAWFSFDDPSILDRAVHDPVGLVDALPVPAAIDEFQRAGTDFLLSIKQATDRRRDRGQLLLTGSTNYIAARGVSETLAGRMGRLTLWPLSVGERESIRETFIDTLFAPEAWPTTTPTIRRNDVVELLLEGGYPEIVTEQLTGRARRDWFEAYTHDVVSREALRPIAEVRYEGELRRLLRIMAARAAGEVQISDIAADAELARSTVANYLSLLEALHLIVQIPAWATSSTTAAKRRSKTILGDTGLAASLCGAGTATFAPTGDAALAGSLFENFVTAEIVKQSAWSARTVDIGHYRDRHGNEVDLIIEDRATGELAAIEIKLSSTPHDRHAKHLRWLKGKTGSRFKLGLVIHTGAKSLPLDNDIWAVPVSALWRND
jgi:predicted AAA+ superfamily ATPase